MQEAETSFKIMDFVEQDKEKESLIIELESEFAQKRKVREFNLKLLSPEAEPVDKKTLLNEKRKKLEEKDKHGTGLIESLPIKVDKEINP